MKTRSKMDPVNKYRNWTKKEKELLKKMTNEGKSINEMSGLIGRTRDDVSYHKNLFGYKKTTDLVRAKKNVKGSSVSSPKGDHTTTRDQARTMARAARDIARSNGKRITMSMFFIEEL